MVSLVLTLCFQFSMVLHYMMIAPKVFVELLYISGFLMHVVQPKIRIEVCTLCYLFVIALSLFVNLFFFLILSLPGLETNGSQLAID